VFDGVVSNELIRGLELRGALGTDEPLVPQRPILLGRVQLQLHLLGLFGEMMMVVVVVLMMLHRVAGLGILGRVRGGLRRQ
jgi:hypothetical protein